MPEPKRPFEIDPALAATLAPSLAVASASAGLAASTLTETSSPRAPAAEHEVSIVGSLLAHFQVERLLGKGGMGEVYLATDIALERQVALKLLPKHTASDPVYRARFLREARAQARLSHPNICHIYFVGEQHDHLFFAMEYIEGETLSERLDKRGPLPPGEAIEYCRMAALGLKEAQRHGYTHRDIKPSNLVIDPHGVVKLVDFGIVKAADRVEEGGIVGTPLYMSPEQARGEPVDFRTDIYSLGATLHQLITGQTPFAGDTPAAVLSQQISSTRPRLISKERAKLKDAALLDQLCDRMMAKRPEDRFASYDELLLALERLSPTHTREAGFWVRAAATGFDFLFVLILSLPAVLFYENVIGPKTDGGNGWIVGLVAMLYEIIGHARTGQTWGKQLFEIEVVSTRPGGRVTWRAATVRFFVQWGLSIGAIVGLVNIQVIDPGPTAVAVVSVALALLLLGGPLGLGALAMRRSGRGTMWDAAAGTRVLYRRVKL